MTAHEPLGSVSLDPQGRLRHATGVLEALNTHAGGSIGAPFVLPGASELATAAATLSIELSRRILVADADEELELWLRATPNAEGVRLNVEAWRRTDMVTTTNAGDGTASDLAWHWTCDGDLHLTYLSRAAFTDLDVADTVVGASMASLFHVDEDAGDLTLIGAATLGSGFRDLAADVVGTGKRVRLSGTPRFDIRGRFAGFSGSLGLLEPEGKTESSVADGALPEAFAQRLGNALRDPLGRIIANADSIGAQADGPLSPDYADYANDIAAAGRHLLALVNDLEDLQAVERPDFMVDSEPIDLAEVARRAAGLLAVRAGRAGVTIERPDAAEALPARGDYRRTLQILVNLIGNAVRYSPEGARVWVLLEREPELACVIVADQGRGIASDDQARVFEKFERVDPSEQGGSGLGLYIARRLARAMGGDISLDSAPGQGARFVLALPLGA